MKTGAGERRCDKCREIYDYRDCFTVVGEENKYLLCEHCIADYFIKSEIITRQRRTDK